jgi:YVTN family beta-propeller protein
MKMSAWIKTAVLIAVLLMAGCQSTVLKPKPLLEDEGEVLIYLEPLAQEAERLKFSLEGISAVREDGSEHPLALLMRDYARPDIRKQRLIASGRLPEGTFTGLTFRVKSASLKTGEGSAALLVPDVPVKKDFLFKVEKKKAIIISLVLQAAESVSDDVHFKPAWFASLPPRPLISLVGYASNVDTNTITVFDKMNLEVTGVIATGDGPRGLVIDKLRNRLYAALSNDDAIDVIQVADGSSLTMIKLFQGDNPGELAITPDGQTLLAVNTGSDTVSFIDTMAFVERGRIAVGKRPRAIVLDKSSRRAYVFNTLSNNISVIDISAKAVMGTISTGPEPIRGQFNRGGDRLYVAHAEYPYLYVVDPQSFSVLQQKFIGTGIRSLKVDTRTDLVYLGKKNDTAIGVYDPFTFSVTQYIPTRGAVDYMTIEGDSNNLYLVIPEKKIVMIVNLINTRNVSEIEVIDGPSWVTMMGER